MQIIPQIILTVNARDREHKGLRRIGGYGMSVSRGAASAMMFTYSSLLVTMCRNMITVLRDTFLRLYIPFDAATEMHKIIAILALISTGMLSYYNYILGINKVPVYTVCGGDFAIPYLMRHSWSFHLRSTGILDVCLAVFSYSSKMMSKHIHHLFTSGVLIFTVKMSRQDQLLPSQLVHIMFTVIWNSIKMITVQYKPNVLLRGVQQTEREQVIRK